MLDDRPLSSLRVPNAPCGVESQNGDIFKVSIANYVPNAPCGVERLLELW